MENFGSTVLSGGIVNMGIVEILIILGISIGSGVAVVEYQKARQDPPPFKSEAPAKDSDVYFKHEIKINGKESSV